MRSLHLPKKTWLVVAAGLASSCFLNPQPEPPGTNAALPGPSAGGAGYQPNTSTQNGAGGMFAGVGGVTQVTGGSPDKADAGAQLDAGSEPETAEDPAE